MLNKEEYLALVKKYLDLYVGKYVYDSGEWVELRTPEVDWHEGEVGRRLDSVRDAYGNSWFVKEELDIMLNTLRILEEDSLPPDAKIIRKRS